VQLGLDQEQEFPRGCPLLGRRVEQGSPVNLLNVAAEDDCERIKPDVERLPCSEIRRVG
jgi:hypothetical protein